MEEQSLRGGHLGIGSPLGSICLGVISESFGSHLEGLRLRRHLVDIWRSDLRNRCLSQLKCKSFFKMLILHCVFEGQITSSVNYKLKCAAAKSMEHGSIQGPFTNTVRTPTDKSVWGI